MPAPFAMPAMVTGVPSPRSTRTAISLGVVSVVIIALTAFRLASREFKSSSTAARIPVSIFRMGKRKPIRPVDATAMSPVRSFSRRATRRVIRRASRNPRLPVYAFALPEFATTAASSPFFTCFIVTRRGAPLIRLVVKAPAAATGPSSLTINIRSSPRRLIPARTPAARNPGTLVTPPSRTVIMRTPISREREHL
ncbi:hypothetical protein ES703_08708 [subsurface metagenome]